MKYAHINENNQLLGWYDKEVHGTYIEPIHETKTTTTDGVETVEKVLVKDGYWDTLKIPTPNIEVSEEAWQNAVNNGHNKVNEDGTTEFFDFRTSEEIKAQEQARKMAMALSPRQARLILLKMELLDDIEVLLASDRAMQIWWEYSLDIRRDSEHLIKAAKAFGLSDEELDLMFEEGAKL